LAGSLWPFWHRHSHRREGRDWLERALDLANSEQAPLDGTIRPLYGAAYLARNRGDYDQAAAYGAACLTVARELGDRPAASRAHQLLAFIALARGDYDAAQTYAEAALAESVALADGSAWTAWVRSDLGMAAYGVGDLDHAERILDETLALYRDFGDPFGTALTLGYLAIVATDRGDHALAAARFAAGLPLWQEMANRENQAEWLAGVAALAVARGQAERAARLFAAADKERDTLGHAFTLPERGAFERAAAGARSALGDPVFEVATAAGRNLPLDRAFAEASDVLTSLTAPAGTGHSAASGGVSLTQREIEVLRLLVEGRSNPQIAAALFISPRTATTHVTNILTQLGVSSRTEAATRAVRDGLL
jgi:DNA-binding NarL/FixJ family response regulator